jgi:hypothetical protein
MQWRATISCATPLPMAWNNGVPHHYLWRGTMVCRVIVYGAADKGYSCKILSSKVYYLNLFQLWLFLFICRAMRMENHVGACFHWVGANMGLRVYETTKLKSYPVIKVHTSW